MEIITVNHIQHATEFGDGTPDSIAVSVSIVQMIVDDKDVKVSIDINNNSNNNKDNFIVVSPGNNLSRSTAKCRAVTNTTEIHAGDFTECVPNSTVMLASVVKTVLDDKGVDVSVDVGNIVCVVVVAVAVDVSAVVESTTIQ